MQSISGQEPQQKRTREVSLGTRFFDACKAGDTQEVQACIEEGINVNIYSPEGWTALHIAVQQGNLSLVKFLCEKTKMEVNVEEFKTESRNTPMHLACALGHLDIVRYFRARGLGSRGNHYTRTPFYLACVSGHDAIVNDFFEQQASGFNSPSGKSELNIFHLVDPPLKPSVRCRIKFFEMVCELRREVIDKKNVYHFLSLAFQAGDFKTFQILLNELYFRRGQGELTPVQREVLNGALCSLVFQKIDDNSSILSQDLFILYQAFYNGVKTAEEKNHILYCMIIVLLRLQLSEVYKISAINDLGICVALWLESEKNIKDINPALNEIVRDHLDALRELLEEVRCYLSTMGCYDAGVLLALKDFNNTMLNIFRERVKKDLLRQHQIIVNLTQDNQALRAELAELKEEPFISVHEPGSNQRLITTIFQPVSKKPRVDGKGENASVPPSEASTQITSPKKN